MSHILHKSHECDFLSYSQLECTSKTIIQLFSFFSFTDAFRMYSWNNYVKVFCKIPDDISFPIIIHDKLQTKLLFWNFPWDFEAFAIHQRPHLPYHFYTHLNEFYGLYSLDDDDACNQIYFINGLTVKEAGIY